MDEQNNVPESEDLLTCQRCGTPATHHQLVCNKCGVLLMKDPSEYLQTEQQQDGMGCFGWLLTIVGVAIVSLFLICQNIHFPN
ncbi:MAG: hypothetical protein HXX17_13250 [Geobacteraceae bacterium]|nr:hypothetical protein [Geobacteraceae bacterium]